MTKKKYSFKHYRRLLCGGPLKKEKTFHQESEKVFTWLQFDETKQSFAMLIEDFQYSNYSNSLGWYFGSLDLEQSIQHNSVSEMYMIGQQ